MCFQKDVDAIKWKVHFKSSRDKVFKMLITDDGRAKFWAESAVETDGHVDFIFPNGTQWRGKILERIENSVFSVKYIGDSKVTFFWKLMTMEQISR
ncbi:MAG: hypothetical protein D8M58_17785 [Calditrichaeota bacterium]|nr:MAG: hypothetical protein DWQ03_01700 [Calditrichota bacterium]MBL1207259.1 hypothetical protein [Calditrichota bacterium]